MDIGGEKMPYADLGEAASIGNTENRSLLRAAMAMATMTCAADGVGSLQSVSISAG
jgi:hypothetical protein